MRHIALYFGIAAALVASCSIHEKDLQIPAQDDVVFYATFEQPAAQETKVYANEDLLLRWTAGDRVSIFNKITYNQQYRFIGETGDYEGGFNKVDDPEFMTGQAIPHVISVYPFQRQTRVSEEEVITVTLPAEQSYAQNSFGLGDNTMVSVSSGNLLQYKTVGGFLVISLYGEGMSVNSISLKGNNGERIAGEATVTMPLDGTPTAVMADNATTEITLTCASPIILGATAEEATQFWFVVPPVTFSKGFTVTVNKNTAGAIEKSTSKSITVERNVLSRMSPFEVEGRIVLSENSFDVPGNGDDIIIDISAPTMPTIGETPSWITYSSGTYSNGSVRFVFHIAKNNSSEPRSATVTVSAKGAPDESFVISQEGSSIVERTDWSVRYVAREDWVNDDGSVDKIEHFKFSYKGNAYYIVRMIHPEDLISVYADDLSAFFTYEAEKLLADAQADGVNFWQYTDEVFDSNITDIYFNRMRSGTWMAFLIELDRSGTVTGNYAKTTFTLQQEVASEAFSKWLGTWRASNGQMGYDLTISSIDNNFIYRIDGWECGSAVSFQMNMEYLEGEFWAPDGNLYITSQYLGTYDDADFGYGTVDELFMGNILESGQLTVITDEGIDIAVMVPQSSDKATLKGADVTIETNSSTYNTTFHSVQYYMWAHSNGNWYPYNSNVAKLPLTMTKLASTRAADSSLAKERTVTKGSIHHGQPKAGRGSRNSIAKKKHLASL